MSARVNYMAQSPELFDKLVAFGTLLKSGTIEEAIHDLVSIRASQLNGCAFCVDMHVKQARIHGERELRLHHLAVWHESPLFTARERAALEWTEALTQLSVRGVADEIYERIRLEFSEKALTELTYAVMTINAWNRLNIAFQPVPGSKDVPFGLSKARLA